MNTQKSSRTRLFLFCQRLEALYKMHEAILNGFLEVDNDEAGFLHKVLRLGVSVAVELRNLSEVEGGMSLGGNLQEPRYLFRESRAVYLSRELARLLVIV